MKREPGKFSPLIVVDRTSAHPLQRQIYDAFRVAIVGRNLRPGQQVPSTRALASELGISRIPVLNAYARLMAEGYFESRMGAGTFVSSSLPEQAFFGKRGASANRSRSRPLRVASPASRIPEYRRPPWVCGQGAFNVSQPALDAFPLKVWSTIVARRSRNPLVSSLQYGDPLGLEELREAIAAYLRTSRVVRCESHQVMIVSGSQQALDLCARVLLAEGSVVWMEEPGYWLARHVLTAAGCRTVPIPVDAEGLDVAAGIRRCPKARAAFVAPSHQYPLGVTMSASRRLQLLDWAKRSGAWIVEDDYDSEYRFESKPVASLQGLDHSSRVVYVGTFSKVLFPSLRVGYMVIPPELIGHFVAMRNAMDVSPPHLYQAVLADFIAEGHFSRHIRRMRALYGERRIALVESLRRELGSLMQVIGDETGLHLTVTLPEGLDDREVAMHAARENLWLWPLSPAYAGKASRQGLILGFGNTTAAEMPRAVHHLRSVLDTLNPGRPAA
jgi:GntR family transcriptional regulator / MocR family aminotransferase